MKRAKFGEPSMSKFRFILIFANSSSEIAATYRVAPTSPDSSAPQNAKRTLLSGLMFCLAIWRASSRLNALPVPLSLMPGPSSTESRWEPTTITLSEPVGVSVVTLNDWRGSLVAVTLTCTETSSPVASSAARSSPMLFSVPTTGMVMSLVPWPSWELSPSVPLSWPSMLL